VLTACCQLCLRLVAFRLEQYVDACTVLAHLAVLTGCARALQAILKDSHQVLMLTGLHDVKHLLGLLVGASSDDVDVLGPAPLDGPELCCRHGGHSLSLYRVVSLDTFHI
jgi:hypothetical protein